MAFDGGHGDAERVYLSEAKGPPRPPPKSRIGLTEVERALSVLEGRHPEHEKIRRQTREAAEQRRGELEVELGRNSRARLRRTLALTTVGVALAIGGWFAWKMAARTRSIQAALDVTEAPWIGRGFARVDSNELTAKRTLEADFPAVSCFVAATTADGILRVNTGSASLEGRRSVAWCSCAAGHASIDAPSAGDGLTLLRVDGSALGGSLARTWVDFTPGAWGDEGGRECADALLDRWLATQHAPAAPEAAWLAAAPARAPLGRAGLRVIATVEAAHPFGIVEAPAGACAIAVSKSGETLSLRGPGGQWRIEKAHGALAWCSATAETLTVWREGAAPVAVLAAPAVRLGGLLGARECAGEAGVPIATGATWLRGTDLPWDADAVLRASGLTDVASSPLAVDPGPLDGRVVALALATGASAVSEPGGVVIACDPPLAPGTHEGGRETVCAHSAPVSWFNKKDALAGSARGSLPFWLSSLQDRHEVDAVARIPELLALARHLAREGFEPTTLEGVTEVADGVRVMGRAGEDAIVAVGLAPRAPWALPYSDGIPWDLGDAPRVVSLEPGKTVKLTSSSPSPVPLNARRTVVFRRATKP
jgi:hypothetical protein